LELNAPWEKGGGGGKGTAPKTITGNQNNLGKCVRGRWRISGADDGHRRTGRKKRSVTGGDRKMIRERGPCATGIKKKKKLGGEYSQVDQQMGGRNAKGQTE